MERGKLYTILGIDGLNISRKTGVTVNLTADSAKVNLDAIEDDIVDDIVDDLDLFVDNGLDALAEVGIDDETGELFADDIVFLGNADDFKDAEFVPTEEDDEDEDEEAEKSSN